MLLNGTKNLKLRLITNNILLQIKKSFQLEAFFLTNFQNNYSDQPSAQLGALAPFPAPVAPVFEPV